MALRRLLLVEGRSAVSAGISTLLRDEGYVVDVAADGRDGLEKARAGPVVDLVLVGPEGADSDGPGLVHELASDPELRNTPVLRLTSSQDGIVVADGRDGEADETVELPEGPGVARELLARIRWRLRLADLSRELADRDRSLEGAQRKLEFELDLARKVQFALMPRPPKPRGVLQVAVRYTPAGQLGGDVYDFYRLENRRLGIFVADVSGHGVNSAMLSGMVKALASPMSVAVLEPGELLAGLDVAAEPYFPDGYFCTAFYLIADEETGLIRYAGVGHPPAIIVGPNGARTLESNPGMLGIGMVDATSGRSERLAPGESLVLYTDGLTDAMSPSDVLFGEHRLRAVLQSHQGVDPMEILNQVDLAVKNHTAPGRASDDINIIILQHPAD